MAEVAKTKCDVPGCRRSVIIVREVAGAPDLFLPKHEHEQHIDPRVLYGKLARQWPDLFPLPRARSVR